LANINDACCLVEDGSYYRRNFSDSALFSLDAQYAHSTFDRSSQMTIHKVESEDLKHYILPHRSPHFNVLVDPIMLSKSTIPCRVSNPSSGNEACKLEKSQLPSGPNGQTMGWIVDLRTIRLPKKIFSITTMIEILRLHFHLSNGNTLTLFSLRKKAAT